MISRQDIVRGRPWDCTYHENIMFDIKAEKTVVYRDDKENCYGLKPWQEAFPQNYGNVVSDPEILNFDAKDFRIAESSCAKELGFENIVDGTAKGKK